MNLFREVMDKEIVDREGYKAGKVDDIVLELRPGKHPRVRAIVTGQGALAPLLGSTIARLTVWFQEQLLGRRHDQPSTIDWGHIRYIDVVVHIDLDRSQEAMIQTDQTIWQRWIKRIPFAER